MLGSIDKVTFTVTNALDENNNNLKVVIKLPLEEYFELPDNIRSVDIIEGHQGNLNGGFVSSRIVIGEVVQLKDIFNSSNKIKITTKLNFESINDFGIITKHEDGTIELFSKLYSDDIVVSDINKMKEAISICSDEIKNIVIASNAIKGLKRRK